MYREDFHFKIGPCKEPLSLGDQLDLMISRGLVVSDRTNALDIIRRTSYYRFSAYTLSLKKEDVFYEGVTFDNVYELYRCDDAFRKIIFNYATYVEIAFRAYISHELSMAYGPLGYLDPNNFEDCDYHADFIQKLEEEVARSDDVFVEHHYTDLDSVFPLWVSIECTSFGDLSKLFKNMKLKDKQSIVKKWLPNDEKYISNWLQCCVYARNVAAHGGRFYNREFQSVPVRLSGKMKKIFSGRTPFAYVFAINKLLPTKALSVQLREDLRDMFKSYPFAQPDKFAFPDNWDQVLTNQSNSYIFYDDLINFKG